MLANKLKNCRNFFSISACLLTGMFANDVLAFTLGDISLESALNEPLLANIQLLELDGLNEAQILVNLGSEADFQRVGVDPLPLLNELEFDVIVLSATEGVVRITSPEAIVEPYLNFVLNVRWPSGRVIREYTVLLDLPTFSSNAIPNPAPAPAISRPTPAPQAEPAPRNAEPVVSTPAAQAAQSPQEVEPAPAPVAVPIPEAQTGRAMETVVIQTGDSLWNIALATRPGNDVSVQQMMLAIQRANSNSDAFIANNINGIRAGRVLRIPTRQEINAISQDQAISQVAVQNQQFNNNAQPLAVNNSQSPAQATSRDELSIIAGSNADDAERTQISGLNETIRNLENELALSNENLDRAQIENEELRSRLGDLEEEIGILENTIAIENQRMAELQAELAARQESEASQLLANSASATEPVPSSAGTGPSAVVDIAPQATETGFVDQIRGFLSSTVGMISGLVLVLALVVGFLMARNRMNGREEDDFDAMLAEDTDNPDFESDPVGEAVTFNEALADGDDSTDDEELIGADDAATDELAESETEDDFLSDDDESDDDFVENEDDDEDSKPGFMAALLAKFSRKKRHSDSDDEDEDYEEGYDEENEEAGFFDEDTEADDDTDDTDDTESTDEADSLADEETDEDFNINDYDFEDDTEDDTEEDLEATSEGGSIDDSDDNTEQRKEDVSASSEVEEINFEGDFTATDDSAESIEFEDISSPEETADITATDADAGKEAEDVFEFKLDDEPEKGDELDEIKEATAETDSKEVESFEFSLSEEPVSLASTENFSEDENAAKPDTEIETLDFGNFASDSSEAADGKDSSELEFIEDEEESLTEIADDAGTKESRSSLGNLGLDDAFATDESDEDELEVITDQDEVSTKLDLAVAYQAMDDLDGAREILDEVLAEGDDEQKAEAQRLLSKWGEA